MEGKGKQRAQVVCGTILMVLAVFPIAGIASSVNGPLATTGVYIAIAVVLFGTGRWLKGLAVKARVAERKEG